MLTDATGWMSDAFGLVAGHSDWALVVTFAGAVIGAVAVAGTILPATFVMMATAGAAAAAGQPMLPFVAVAVAGGVIGETVSFWIGFRYRRTIRQWWPLARWPRLLTGADRFFERYGSYSVALCRFIPVLRSTVPMVAGVAGMPRRRFMIANVASAFVWAPAHVCPAELAGLSVARMAAGDRTTAALLGLAVAVCCAAIFLLHRRLTRAAAIRR